MPKQVPREITIRPARLSELVSVSELARRIWYAHYPGIITTQQIEYMLGRDYAIETLARDVARGVSIDLMLVDGEEVGFAAYEPTGAPGEVKLHKIYLETELHGRGLGSRLLDHVERQVAERGYSRIILQVNKRNDKAIAAYLRNGYVKEQAIVVDIGEGFVMDDYLMVKSVAGSHRTVAAHSAPRGGDGPSPG